MPKKITELHLETMKGQDWKWIFIIEISAAMTEFSQETENFMLINKSDAYMRQ